MARNTCLQKSETWCPVSSVIPSIATKKQKRNRHRRRVASPPLPTADLEVCPAVRRIKLGPYDPGQESKSPEAGIRQREVQRRRVRDSPGAVRSAGGLCRQTFPTPRLRSSRHRFRLCFHCFHTTASTPTDRSRRRPEWGDLDADGNETEDPIYNTKDFDRALVINDAPSLSPGAVPHPGVLFIQSRVKTPVTATICITAFLRPREQRQAPSACRRSIGYLAWRRAGCWKPDPFWDLVAPARCSPTARREPT